MNAKWKWLCCAVGSSASSMGLLWLGAYVLHGVANPARAATSLDAANDAVQAVGGVALLGIAFIALCATVGFLIALCE